MSDSAPPCSAALPRYGVLTIRGPDARSFLQGQATCNIDEASDARALPGGLCNPQGRLYSSFLVVSDGSEDLLLRMHADIISITAANLNKYIVFSKADSADESEYYAITGLWGRGSRELIDEVCPEPPTQTNDVVTVGRDKIIQRDDTGERFECWLAAGEESLLAEALTRCIQCDAREWDALAVLAGEAEVQAATADEFIPQMLNYDVSGHVSFTKGCYTGQEVVARLHYRGTAKQIGRAHV